MITRVLVGLTGTRYEEAVAKAAVEIAVKNEARLTGVTALDLQRLRNVGPVPPGGGQAAKELREHRIRVSHEAIEQSVAHFEQLCNEAGVEHQILHEEREEPFDFLISQSRYHDLTVLSLKGIFEYEISAGNQTDASLTIVRLISGGVRPILAVPSEMHEVKKVFVAYSGSISSAATMRRFMQLRPHPDTEVRIATFEMDAERSARLLKHAAEYCRGYGVEADTMHSPKSPYESLLSEASDYGADLIVLGNSAQSLLARRVLGETALHVIQESELPLFLSQ